MTLDPFNVIVRCAIFGDFEEMLRLFVLLFALVASPSVACVNGGFAGQYNKINRDYRPLLQATFSAVDELAVTYRMAVAHIENIDRCLSNVPISDPAYQPLRNLRSSYDELRSLSGEFVLRSGGAVSDLGERTGQESYGLRELMGTVLSGALSASELRSIRSRVERLLPVINEQVRLAGRYL